MKGARKFFYTLLLFAFLIALKSQAVEVAFEQDSSLPLVYINVAVKAGAAADPDGQSGLSNFMASMLLRGTRLQTKEQIDLKIDQLGARLEVETRSEALILRGAVLASKVKPFLSLLAEILTQPAFREREIRKLKSEIVSALLEELGQDSSLASRKFNSFLFQGHPYGKPVLGKIKDVENLTREQIIAHYEKNIRDQRILVLGSGLADPSLIQEWAKQIAIARPGGEELEKVKRPVDAPTRRLLIVDKPDRTQTQILIGQIGVLLTDSKFFPLYLGNFAFGGGSFNSRLMSEIRVKRGWSYGAYSYFRHGLQPRSWQIHLFPAMKDTPNTLAYSIKMLEDLKDQGIRADEFDFAQRSQVNSAGFMFNTAKKRVENKLLEHTLNLPDGFMKNYGHKLSQLKLEQVNEALRDFLKPNQLTIVVVGTAKNLKEPLAKAAGIPVEQVQVVPYTEE